MAPGDLVVCVNVGIIKGANNRHLSLLKIGDVYTVERIVPDDVGEPKFAVGVLGVKGTWHPERFRPCRKTNIDQLVAIAKEVEHEVV